MLEFFRKRRKSSAGILIIGLMTLLMAGFGISSIFENGASRRDAATVDGEEISYNEYIQAYSSRSEMMRSRYGAQFDSLRQFFNLEQDAIDSIIAERLQLKFIHQLGLGASDEQVREKITSIIGQIDQGQYLSFLKQQRISAYEFETKVKLELVNDQLREIGSEIVAPGERELRSVFQAEHGKARFVTASLKREDFAAQVDLAPIKLEEYLKSNQKDYRRPKRVAFEYVVFNPSDFVSKVVVGEDELRDLYEQSSGNYLEPAKLHLKKILVKKPINPVAPIPGMKAPKSEQLSSKDSVEAKKAVAEAALKRVKDGEPFEKVAKEISEDAASAPKGGDIGWVYSDALEEPIKEAALKLGVAETTPVIELPDGFQVLFLEDLTPARQKSFEEVRSVVESEYRKNDAPLYASEAAQAALSKWLERGTSLKEFAAAEKFTLKSSEKPLRIEDEPSGGPAGLIEQVFGLAQGDKTSLDVEDGATLVEVLAVEEPREATLDEVKEELQADYVRSESLKLATAKAEELLKKLKSDTDGKARAFKPQQSLELASKQSGFVVEQSELKSKTELSGGLFSAPEAKAVIFELSTETPLAAKVFSTGDLVGLIELAERVPASEEEYKKEQASLSKRESAAASSRLSRSLIENLKSDAEIKINPEIVKGNTTTRL